MNNLRYNVAACQTDLPNPEKRDQISQVVDKTIEIINMAIEGYSPFLPVKLLVFPEFVHAAPIYSTAAEFRKHLTIPIPNEHTERYVDIARSLDVYIQTGSFLEEDPKWPGAVFNTSCMIGPDGILTKYRKVNPWIPLEVQTSPHDLEGYDEELFPVAKTPIGNFGVAICYDWLFPEVLRQISANGAEVLIRVSAYMDPWGATSPMDWWTVVNRCRALENIAYVVASNQGASLTNFPPYSWPGGSMVIDFEGRLLAQADPGPGSKIVVAPIDLSALRHEREVRQGHHMLAHLRTETYPVYKKTFFAPGQHTNEQDLNEEKTQHSITVAKRNLKC